jgi:hypothetical protein
MNKQGQKWISFLVIIYIVWGLGHLVLAAWYAPPNAEDFALSVAPKNVGKLNSVVQLLVYYDSRFTANILHAVNPLVFNGYHFFYLTTLFTLALFIASFYFFIGSLNQGNIKPGVKFLMAATIVVTYYAYVPSLPYGLYYMASTFTYVYPAILWLLWVGCWLRMLSSEGYRFYIYSILGLVSLLFSFGCTELYIIINAFTLAVVLFVSAKRGKTVFFNSLPFLLVGILGVFLVFNFPSKKFVAERLYGNLNERYPESNFFIYSLGVYAKHWVKLFLTPSVVFTLFVFAYWFKEFKYLKVGSPGKVMLWAFGLQLVAYILCWAYFIPRGSVFEDPVYIFNATLLVALNGALFTLPMALFLTGVWSKYELYLPTALALLLFAGFMAKDNYASIRNDYSEGLLTNAYSRQQAFYHSVDSVKQFNNKRSVIYFKQMSKLPTSVALEGDLLPNRESEDWNLAYELYFNVDEVRLPGDTIFK